MNSDYFGPAFDLIRHPSPLREWNNIETSPLTTNLRDYQVNALRILNMSGRGEQASAQEEPDQGPSSTREQEEREEWRRVTDHDERRRIQNRQAQRRFSKCKSLPILQTYYTLSYIDDLFLAVPPWHPAASKTTGRRDPGQRSCSLVLLRF
jgi:hypothetical protein